jgi:hypothetical protein
MDDLRAFTCVEQLNKKALVLELPRYGKVLFSLGKEVDERQTNNDNVLIYLRR